ncbi:MAG: ABC transporter ATP-binding protein [Pseudomonadota bacterium]
MTATGPGSSLSIDNLSVTLDGRSLLRDISLRLGSGELVVLIGPNGAGKTTLLRCAIGLTTPNAGSVLIDGQEPRHLSATARARLLSYLPQTRVMTWPLLVEDTVALGRFAYGAAPGRLNQQDAAAIARALHACDLTRFAQRATNTLSGGELARVHCARVFAAETPWLIADEPVAALDPLHQFQVMALLRKYVERGGGALVVLHDIALAARFADRLLWLHDGQLIADGSPRETLTAQRLRTVFGMEASVEESPAYGLGVRLLDAASPVGGA